MVKSGSEEESAPARSEVNVAIPHWRGRKLPRRAIWWRGMRISEEVTASPDRGCPGELSIDHYTCTYTKAYPTWRWGRERSYGFTPAPLGAMLAAMFRQERTELHSPRSQLQSPFASLQT